MYDRCQWKFQYCNKHIIKNVSILKYVIGADGKIIKSSIVKDIFLLIALISERKEKYNTGRIFVKYSSNHELWFYKREGNFN